MSPPYVQSIPAGTSDYCVAVTCIEWSKGRRGVTLSLDPLQPDFSRMLTRRLPRRPYERTYSSLMPLGRQMPSSCTACCSTICPGSLVSPQVTPCNSSSPASARSSPQTSTQEKRRRGNEREGEGERRRGGGGLRDAPWLHDLPLHYLPRQFSQLTGHTCGLPSPASARLSPWTLQVESEKGGCEMHPGCTASLFTLCPGSPVSSQITPSSQVHHKLWSTVSISQAVTTDPHKERERERERGGGQRGWDQCSSCCCHAWPCLSSTTLVL